jgi:hypothetical protein
MAVTKLSSDGISNSARFVNMRAGFSGTSRIIVWGNSTRLYSNDGATWTATTQSTLTSVGASGNYPVTKGGRIFALQGQFWNWSYDGITWYYTNGVAGDANASVDFWGEMASGDIAWNSYYGSTRHHLMREYSGTQLAIGSSPFSANSNGIANNGVKTASTVWVMAFAATSFAYSTNDGISWTTQSPGVVYTSINWGKDKFLATTNSGTTYYTSADGVTWTSRTFPITPQTRTGIRYVEGQWFLGGLSGALYTSPDGITWTSRTSGAGANRVNGFGYAANLYVAVGNGGYVATSPDGATWTARSSGTVNDLFVVGGI